MTNKLNLFLLGNIILLLLFLGFPLSLSAQESSIEIPKLNIFGIPAQSASYVRMPSRMTNVETDAVFFNPANLANMEDGLHFSINNLSLFQDYDISSQYDLFDNSDKKVKSNLRIPFFPSLFVNYKKNKSSIHLGLFYVGGTGKLEFDNLFLLERNIADLKGTIPYTGVPGLIENLITLDQQIMNSTGSNPGYSQITDYRYNFKAIGLAACPTLQLGYSRKINEFISVGLDFRGIYFLTQYDLDINAIQVLPFTNNPELNEWQSPGDYYRSVAEVVGNPAYNFAAEIVDNEALDRLGDAHEKGIGYSIVPSILFSYEDKYWAALKYESNAKINLKTDLINGNDAAGIFIQDFERKADLPAILSMGIGGLFFEKLRVNTGFRYHFFKRTNFDGRESFVKKNPVELELGISYKLNNKLTISTGMINNSSEVEAGFQNELQAFLNGNYFSGGFEFIASKRLKLNAGIIYSKIKSETYTYDDHDFALGISVAVEPPEYSNEYEITYDYPLLSLFSIGINYSLFESKEK